MIDKQKAFHFLLEQSAIFSVFVTHQNGSVLPESQKAFDMVCLDFGSNLAKSIPDLFVDDSGITATLSFDNVPFKTVLPWNSIVAMGVPSEVEFVWKASMPEKKRIHVAPSRGGLKSV